MVFRQFQVIMQ